MGRAVEAPAEADVRYRQAGADGAGQVQAAALQPARPQIVGKAVARRFEQFLQRPGRNAVGGGDLAQGQVRLRQQGLDGLADPVQVGRTGRIGAAQGGWRILRRQVGDQEFGQGQFNGAQLLRGQFAQSVGGRPKQAGKHVAQSGITAEPADLQRERRHQSMIQRHPGGVDEQKAEAGGQLQGRIDPGRAIDDVAGAERRSGLAVPERRLALQQHHQPDRGGLVGIAA